MSELQQKLAQVADAAPYRVVLSAPRKGAAYRRAVFSRREQGYQLEKLTERQAFHENISEAELLPAAEQLLQQSFTQMVAFSQAYTYQLRLTKKEKVLFSRHKPTDAEQDRAQQTRQAQPAHDRAKKHPLPEGVAVAPLVDMGVMTQDGRVVAAKRDKYRQVNRFIEIIADALDENEVGPLRILDFGCGKSALSFVLYYYLKEVRGISLQMTGLDLKEDVVALCNASAARYGYEDLRFLAGDIADYAKKEPADMVVTLHACDIATDLALAKAVGWNSARIFSVPCCQHELNAQMESEELAVLTRYGLVKERIAALMTDAVRANLLTACGYKTQLVEFVDFEHTPKNIMIRAIRRPMPMAVRCQALAEVQRLCKTFGLQPCLLRLLQEQGALNEVQKALQK